MGLSTLQKTAAAIAVACPRHKVAAGERCPDGLDGACHDRRTAALDQDGQIR
ncbi:MAG TPA: hypothetical protein VFQ44_02065 [Streptosporangiaceae bacterium]|nr:hypothetical protein [Streptosporangiaceae bacterium]